MHPKPEHGADAPSVPDRIAIDAAGFGWRVWDDAEHWSMVPTNPDNSPIPKPVTWFIRADRPSGQVTESAFPVDDVTLDLLWAAIHPGPDAERSSLFDVLDVLAGIDPTTDHEHLTEIGENVYEDDRVHYSPHDAISALITEVRRLRG